MSTNRNFAAFAVAVVLTGCGGGLSDQQRAEVRKSGEACIVAGFNEAFVNAVKQELRDPNSFEAIETRIDPIGPDGNHRIGMRFRSKNGFGGMDEMTAIGTVDGETCSHATVTNMA